MGCNPTSSCYHHRNQLTGMKMNYIINTARFLNRFGKAWLIKRVGEKHELVGGSDQDYTEAKEWISLFAHEVF